MSDIADIRKSSAAGAPTKVTKASEMTDTDKNYLYLGTESGYNSGHIYYFVEGVLTDGGAYGGVNVDTTLTQSGQAADAKVTGDEIEEIKEDLLQKVGLSDEAKQALLACFAKVAWIDEHGKTYYDALEDALYPPAELARISAVFDSSAVIYNTNTLDDLRQYLTVTAIYSDHTTATVTEYTLSGMLAEGTSIITVNYEGKTTTFIVAVTAVTVSSINATYVQSGLLYPYDNVDKLKNDLTVSALWSDGTTTTLSENDYTLNGTLLPGIATITATHDGKSSSFTVSVETPTWRYSASDGTLLSEQSYINNASINQLCTEEIFDGKLRLTSPQNSAEPAIEYHLTPQINTHAAVRLKVRYISIPVGKGAVGLRISLSDGSEGSRIGVHALVRDNSITKLTARKGTKDVDIAEIALNVWYEILLVKNGLNTTVALDGVEIYNSDSPSTSYTTENKIWNQSVPKSPGESWASIVDIDYIEYYNYDVAG